MRPDSPTAARGATHVVGPRWLRAIGVASLLHVAVAAPWLMTLASPSPAAPPPDAPLAVELATLQRAPAAPEHQQPIAARAQAQTQPQTQPQPQPRTPTLARPTPPIPRATRSPEPQTSPVAPVLQAQEAPEPPTARTEVAEAAPAPSHTPDKAVNPTAPVLGQSPQPQLSPAQTWESQVLTQLERFKRYPAAARWQQQQDTVYLRLQIARDGTIKASSVLRSQGFQALDDEVVEMTRRVGQLPPPPADVPGATVALTVPVEFYIGSR